MFDKYLTKRGQAWASIILFAFAIGVMIGVEKAIETLTIIGFK